jgi:hypothetical protein
MWLKLQIEADLFDARRRLGEEISILPKLREPKELG